MSAIYRKTPKGDIEVRLIPGTTILPMVRAFRVSAEGHRMEIAQMVVPERQQVHTICKGIYMQMLYSVACGADGAATEFRDLGDCGTRNSRKVWYPGTVILTSSRLHDPYCMLTNTDGDALSGSNTHGDGNLCLGNSFSPLSLEALDLLINNKANADLGWKGSALKGKFVDKIFHIDEWPTINASPKIETAVLDFARNFNP